MNVGFPMVAVIDGKWYAATCTRRLPEESLAKGVDMAADLTYFDPQLRSWLVLEAVPYFNGSGKIPAIGTFFIECGADSNEERELQAARRAEYIAATDRYDVLLNQREKRELTDAEGAELATLKERFTANGQAQRPATEQELRAAAETRTGKGDGRISGADREQLSPAEEHRVGAAIEISQEQDRARDASLQGGPVKPDDDAALPVG